MKIVIILISLALIAPPLTAAEDDPAAGRCMTCHKERSPGLYRQWYGSEHATHNVTCLSCHRAEKGDADAYEHYGTRIATLVTPSDCGRCHKKEAAEVAGSYHATAGKILESADAYLAHVAGGHPVAVAGCESCHGGKVQVDRSRPNRLAAESWPNSGIGRINPDGSLGSCTPCHTRHAFSKAQARQPEACSKCHLGPDHPQKEVYEESKHGNAYATSREGMNLASDQWVAGVDYHAAPTCATCHLSAGPSQPTTHDVGARIAWTLRPPISKHKDDWPAKRRRMTEVCTACHGQSFAEGHFAQFDAVVHLYDEKFATPATELMELVKRRGLLERPAAFANEIEWEYWELWHHEGRRARHGAAMGGPDYTWWHGLYEVAHRFYFELIPAARELHDPEVDAFVDRLLAEPMHRWMSQDTETLKKAIRSGAMQRTYAHLSDEG